MVVGVCMVVGDMHGCRGRACIGYDEIRSMSVRYTSYWNAFLFCKLFAENCMKMKEFGHQGGPVFLALPPPMDPPMPPPAYIFSIPWLR